MVALCFLNIFDFVVLPVLVLCGASIGFVPGTAFKGCLIAYTAVCLILTGLGGFITAFTYINDLSARITSLNVHAALYGACVAIALCAAAVIKKARPDPIQRGLFCIL